MNFENLLGKMNNPFKHLTHEEKVELNQIEASVKKDIKDFAVLAKELFDDSRYIKLKKEFHRVYEQTIRLMIYLDTDNKDIYAFKMRELQIQLRTLKSIFDTPEGFVKSLENIENANQNEQSGRVEA